MAVSKDEILQYNWLGREEGFIALEHEIIFRDLCCGCGACEAVCPEKIIEVDEFPKLVGKCTNCGYCLMQCPRAFISPAEVEERLYGSYSEEPLGHIKAKLGARALDKEIQQTAQDGGFVTALLKYVLENKIIDGAIVAGAAKNWKPIPMLVTSAEEISKTSGTKYSNSPNLSCLAEAKEKGLEKLAVVGLPCQIEGIRKIQYYPIEDVGLNRIKFTVGLFCKSNFLYDGLMKVMEKYKVDISKMKKIDIKGKSFIAYSGRRIEIPLEEVRIHEREGCKVCADFTSRLSDLSVGSAGSPEGYSTVFARSKVGVEMLEKMKKDGAIETVEVKEAGIETILSLQNAKLKHAKSVTRKKIRKLLPLPFKYLQF